MILWKNVKCNQELKVLWDGRLQVYLAKVIFFLFTAETVIFLLVAIEKKLIMEMSICPFFYVTFLPGGKENKDKLLLQQ